MAIQPDNMTPQQSIWQGVGGNNTGSIKPDPPASPSPGIKPNEQNPLQQATGSVMSMFQKGKKQFDNTLSSARRFQANSYRAAKEAERNAPGAALTGLGTVGNILDTDHRLVSGLIYPTTPGGNQIEKHIQNSNYAIWHPSAQLSQRLRNNQERITHTQNPDIDRMVDAGASLLDAHIHHGVGKAIKPYIGNAIKSANDLISDTIFDPVSALGVVGDAIKGTKAGRMLEAAPHLHEIPAAVRHNAVQVAQNPAFKPVVSAAAAASHQLFKQTHNALHRAGAAQLLPHLAPIAQAMAGAGNRIHKAYTDTFVVRPDLHEIGVTQKGKQIRLQLEDAQAAARQNDSIADAKALAAPNPQSAMNRFLGYIHAHGQPLASANVRNLIPSSMHITGRPTGHLTSLGRDLDKTIAAFKNASPADKAKILAQTRSKIHNGELLKKTKDMFEDPANKELSNRKVNWDDYKPPSGTFERDLHEIGNLGQKIGNAAIQYDPLPHIGPLGNEAQLTFMHGGLDAWAKSMAAIGSAAKNGIDQKVEARLQAMGALQPGYIAPKSGNKFLDAANELFHKAEHGYRQGLLEHLDKTLGPSAPGSKEELFKGVKINEALGDARNVSKFVQFFKNMGGFYTVYHLATVPASTAKSIFASPQRFLMMDRAETDIQNNRKNKSNILDYGGPTQDIAGINSLSDIPNYALNSSTLGIVKQGFDIYNAFRSPGDQNGDFGTKAIETASRDIGPVGALGDTVTNIQGQSMPGQTMSLADHLAMEFLNAQGWHIRKRESQKSINKEFKRLNRYGMEVGE